MRQILSSLPPVGSDRIGFAHGLDTWPRHTTRVDGSDIRKAHWKDKIDTQWANLVLGFDTQIDADRPDMLDMRAVKIYDAT